MKRRSLSVLHMSFLVVIFGAGILSGFFAPFLKTAQAASTTNFAPTDPNATNTTVNLYRNLKRISGNMVLFGQHESTTFGINANGSTWMYDANRSDVETITGSFPAVYGYDLSGIEPIDNAVNEWSKAKMDHQLIEIQDAYARGGIITMTWHCWNFVTGGSFYDTGGSVVPKILPGGPLNDLLNICLDRIAAHVGNLNDTNNRSIPILFRPWHENNGEWFWWGAGHCTPEEYKQLYRYTYTYLTNVKNVHNFLWVYSPNDPLFPLTEQDVLESYPGDNYVDILGLDTYQDHNINSLVMDWKYKARQSLASIVDLANARGKVAVLAEVGVRDGLYYTTNSHWFVNELLDLLKNDNKARQVSYCLVWFNLNTTNFCVPYPGQRNEQDFIEFYNDPYTGFQNDITGWIMYQDCDISDLTPNNFGVTDGIFLIVNWALIACVVYIFIWRRRNPRDG